MKTRLIALIAFFGLVCAFLLPVKTSRHWALAENLWTSRGHWKHPSSQTGMVEWKRTEYGLVRPWFIIDREFSGSAWYARADAGRLAFYAVASLLLTVFVASKWASWTRK